MNTRPAPIYLDKLLAQLELAGRSTVVRHQGSHLSGEALRAMIFQYARVLYDVGITRGKLVAMFAPNRPEAIAIRYAAHILGAGAVYLSVPPTEEQRQALLKQMAPDLLVVFPETIHYWHANAGVRLATVGVDCAASCDRLDVLASSASDTRLDVMAWPEDLAVIISSGGTTGVPKGSCRSFAAYTAMVSVPSPSDRRQLVNGHLAYLSQVLVDITLLGGGCVVLEGAYEAADTLATIEAERITDLFLVEPQLFELMDHPDVRSRNLSSLRTLTHIGASAPQTLRLRARERLGPVIAHTYGASEMGIVSMLTPAEHNLSRPDLFTCAGRILPGVEVRFRLKDGSLGEPGDIGSIEVRSPAMASGYRNRPELEAANFKAGWYCSGDLGRLDSDGYLHILGRAADASEVNGILVTPTLIQDVLCGLSSVRYAVVVIDNEARVTIAAVSAWTGLSIGAETCHQAVAEHFGQEIAASLVVVSLDRIPLTEQGKPNRAAIKALARSRSLVDAA
ncbi:AMP-binding protein [Bradyrhizobium sp. STM 3557]|uniref:AMP-binding protein n=1 Tax=Bradyrhizobium sp. STM 3557 TaxID=578920 RepID=UPI0038905652